MTRCRFDEETGRNADDAGMSRRTLLRGAAAGFALTASGLFLPADDEAAAREGAYGGELGGRRGRDRRGLDTRKRRNSGDKKDKGKGKDDRPPGAGAPGGSPIKYVAIRAEGDGQTNVNFYYRTIDGLGRWSNLKLGKFDEIPDSRSHVDYAPKMYSIAVYYFSSHLPYPVLIEVRNPLIGFPWAEVTWGCTIDGNGKVVGGSTYHRDGESELPMDGNTGIHFETGWGNPNGNSSISVYRLEDSDTHKWFGADVHWLG